MPDSIRSPAATERFWNILLGCIRADGVIPIIGRELLIIEHEGRCAPLMDIVADLLAAEARADGALDERRHSLPAHGADISSVIGLIDSKAREGFLGRAHELLAHLCASSTVPEPLRQLVEIDAFKLFVSTTPDPFLTDHVHSITPGGLLPWQRLAYLPGADLKSMDLDRPAPWDAPIVYRLFGESSCTTNTSAISDEALLEFTTALHNPENRPKLLFDALKDHHLLVLGTGFPDWLARFFLRLLKNEPFSNKENNTSEYIADSDAKPDSRLGFFLERYGQKTELCPGSSAVEFVAELHRRWKASTPSPDDAKPGGVFISYSRADLPAVERLAERLEKARIPFWFDKRELQPGDPFWQVIERNIAVSSIFLPVISETTRARTAAHTGDRRQIGFWREWLHALGCLAPGDATTAGLHRVIPVGVDSAPPASVAYLPEPFSQVHIAHAPAGAPPDDLLRAINNVINPRGTFAGR